MLLSAPTWAIHISSMAEWIYAAVLLYRYGADIQRPDVQRFALCMIPHWLGGLCVIIYHLLGDAVLFWLDLSKLINCFGSASLLYATLRLLYPTKLSGGITAGAWLITLHVPMVMQSAEPSAHASEWIVFNPTLVAVLFQTSSAIYLAFLIALLAVYRRDKSIFSATTVVGFWFLLVFVAITIGCIYAATKLRGYPTLTHDDVLHGFAEFFLTVSNLLIVIGIRQKQREFATS